MVSQLCEPIVENGIHNANFFNGRLLSAEALQEEQAAQRKHRRLLGQTIGAGVASGLQVHIDNFQANVNNATLLVKAGTAINAAGQALQLVDDVQVVVAQQAVPSLQVGGLFGKCVGDVALPTSIGIYLLLLAPASELEGSAPMSGLGSNGQITGCGRRYEVEGVQFKLVKINFSQLTGLGGATLTEISNLINATNLPWSTSLPANDAASLSRLRNLTAYLCLGSLDLSGLPTDPFALLDGKPRYERYGLLDALATLKNPPVTSQDVPLALLSWTARGLRFVDNWSVRRRVSPAWDLSPWSALLGERRTHEGEAMILQFAEHIDALRLGSDGFPQVPPGGVKAKDYFFYLPPAGILPLQSELLPPFVSPQASAQYFFQGLKVRDMTQDPLYLEGGRLRALLSQAVDYLPVDLSSQELIWVYRVRENQQAMEASATGTPAPYLVFANGRVPYMGDARYDLNYFDYSNYF